MKLAAVSTVKDEADIIGATMMHLFMQGVTDFYIADGMSTDRTRDILRAIPTAFPVKVYDDDSPYHRQPYWVSRLAEQAFEDGADWVIPFDADEFWYSPSGATLFDVLADIPDEVVKTFAKMYHHYSWDEREANPKPIPKVAFRAHHPVSVDNGNHDVALNGRIFHGLLEIRELQYRGEDHFVRKVRERIATLDPSLPSTEGEHHNRFAHMSDDELREWWRAGHPFWGSARSVVHDPIPSRFKVGQCTTQS